MVLDFDNVERAMNTLAETEQGHAALDYLNSALKEFRSKIGVELNGAEFKYVVERLAAQRQIDEQPVELAEVSGFDFATFEAAMFPGAKASLSAGAPTTPRLAIPVNRFVGAGFVIKTAVT